MQDDIPALFAYDRWANGKVFDACRKLTAEQFVAEPVPGWSSVRSTLYHIALATEKNLRALDGDPDDRIPAEADLATVDDTAEMLERAYRRFEELALGAGLTTPSHIGPQVSSERRGRETRAERGERRGRETRAERWLNALLTLRAIGRSFTLPRWAILRHIVNHSTYHRGQAASKLKRFGIEPPNTDFFWWMIEQVPQDRD